MIRLEEEKKGVHGGNTVSPVTMWKDPIRE
jgi:hypothetical protein